jgi:SAM-dependent methyltransferase
MQERYERRRRIDEELYDPFVPFNTMAILERFRGIIRLIARGGLDPVSSRTVLEIGCGNGANLLQLLLLGFRPENLVGNELLEERATLARRRLPSSTRVIMGDAAELALGDETFDIVYQSTVFTSILDDSFQQKLANRMWDLTKPGGGIIWYDAVFNNPFNADIKGIKVKRIRQLFPLGNVKAWRISLAPPIGRAVTKISPYCYSFFNSMPFLRSHVLCWIAKNG